MVGELDLRAEQETVERLLEGDPAIRWQTMRDLMGADKESFAAERRRISQEGWGAKLLAWQEPSGRWGGGLYSPKWISTHYTTLLLRRLGLAPDDPQAQKACRLMLDEGFFRDGGINFSSSKRESETCITGMVLSMLAYFEFQDERMERIVEHLLGQQMADGGWNCQAFRGATHSSFHTTISVLEGLREHEKRNPAGEATVVESQERGREFLLAHKLFRSDRTGEIVDPRMTRFSFPPRWHYDIMRGIIKKTRRVDGRWPLQNRHAGKTYFEMEKPGRPSRWNTLRGLRILRWWAGISFD